MLYKGNPVSSVGVKLDGGKAAVVQGVLWYFPRALQAVAAQSDYGREKYQLEFADKNFLRVDGGVERYTDGLGRHLLGEAKDEGGIDGDSGLPHAYAVAWNALARLEMMLIAEESEIQDSLDGTPELPYSRS